MNRIKLLTLTLMLLAFSMMSCEKDDELVPILPASIEDDSEMTKALEAILNNTEVPGFAFAMIKGEKLVYKNAFGLANIEESRSFTINTQMNIASMSKTFVGAATVKAIEMGLFTPDTPINDLLDFEVVHPHHTDASILVEHLFTHTSGIIDQPEVYFLENYSINPDENLNSEGAQLLMTAFNIPQREQKHMRSFLYGFLNNEGALYQLENFSDSKPGANWAYSNIGTGLLAYIIERQSGLSFADFVKNKVFNPLNMFSTTYLFEEVDPNNMARQYLNKQTDFPYCSNDSYAEGGIYTSIDDLGLYMWDMMNALRAEQGVLFAPEYYRLLFQDQLESGMVPSDFADNHGVFWIKKDGKYMHGGNSFGVSTYIELDPQSQQAYVLICNLDSLFDSSEFEKFYKLIQEAITKFNSKKIF